MSDRSAALEDIHVFDDVSDVDSDEEEERLLNPANHDGIHYQNQASVTPSTIEVPMITSTDQSEPEGFKDPDHDQQSQPNFPNYADTHWSSSNSSIPKIPSVPDITSLTKDKDLATSKHPHRLICLIVLAVFLTIGAILCAVGIGYLWIKSNFLPATTTSPRETTWHTPPTPLVVHGVQFSASSINISEPFILDENAVIDYDAVNRELLVSYYDAQQLRLRSLIFDANSLNPITDIKSIPIHPLHQNTNCRRRSHDIYCCLTSPPTLSASWSSYTYCADALNNRTHQYRITTPEISDSRLFPNSSYLFSKESNSKYAILDFWQNKGMKVDASSIKNGGELEDVDMPTATRFDILVRTKIHGKYFIATFHHSLDSSEGFVFNKTSHLIGSDGSLSNRKRKFCTDASLTYHAVLSFDKKDFHWHLEIFSATNLTRIYYASERIKSASGALKIVCEDKNSVAVFVVQNRTIKDELAIVKYSFAVTSATSL